MKPLLRLKANGNIYTEQLIVKEKQLISCLLINVTAQLPNVSSKSSQALP
jgi:hypothetical protein